VSTTPGSRRLFIDWCRGLAVLCMIEHHHFDAFMPEAFHGSALDRLFRFVGGVAAPSFLFLAGVSMVLMMERQHARGADRRKAALAAARRASYILLGAYLFRFQEWALAWGASPAWTMLRIDVLNCIGVALVAVAALWALGRSPAARAALFFAAAALVALAAPLVLHADLSSWPPHLADYLNGRSPRALFPLFPWAAYAFAGAIVGVLFARAEDEARLVGALAAGSLALFFAVRAVDALPFHAYAQSDWWIDSPAYFLERTCSEVWLLAACWGLERLLRRTRWTLRALTKLGQHSLIVYWVHVELVYGRLTWKLRGTLSLAQASLALAILLAMMVVLSYAVEPAKNKLSTFNFQLSTPS
jgi:uncharacterized membrane protein